MLQALPLAKTSSPIVPFLQMRNRGPTLGGAVATLKGDQFESLPGTSAHQHRVRPHGAGRKALPPTRGESYLLNGVNMFARGQSRIQFQPTCKAHD